MCSPRFLISLARVLSIASIAYSLPSPSRGIASVKRSVTEIGARYDYVIVGGGQSGMVVANRLTEDPTSKKRDDMKVENVLTGSIRNCTCGRVQPFRQ